MSKPTRKPKVPHGCVILEPGEKPPKGAVMCRWGSSGPGYHPGRAAKWKGKVYASPDFPMAVVADWLG